jgi:8-oxo-dGTP pyrophosphatase MutT (NUDIX family)
MSFLHRLAELNNFSASTWRPWWIGAVQAGWLAPATVEFLVKNHPDFQEQDHGFTLDPRLNTLESRNKSFADLGQKMVAAGLLPRLHGEQSAIRPNWDAAPLGRLDRRVAPLLGVRSYGIHVNGIVRRGEDFWMWIARRAADRDLYPNLLDNVIAGGLPDGISVADNLAKEAHEEAGFTAAQIATAKPVGSLQYCQLQGENRLKPDTLFVYDLWMPEAWQPVNTDGEVAEFHLMPIDEVANLAAQGGVFKPNCALVIVDFMIRHGLIDPDHPHYLTLCYGLRQKLPTVGP